MTLLTRTMFGAVCIGVGSLLASSAHAQQFYLGAGFGQGNVSVPSVSAIVLGTPFTGAADKTKDTAYKLYGGYQFTPNWGVELGYNDLGNKYSIKGLDAGIPYGATYKLTSWYVAATGTLPIQGGFSLIGKLGASGNKTSGGDVCALGVCEGLGSESKTDIMVGVGAQYTFTKGWAARLEYENYGKMSTDDVWGTGDSGALKADAWYLSVNYTF